MPLTLLVFLSNGITTGGAAAGRQAVFTEWLSVSWRVQVTYDKAGTRSGERQFKG